ncbi:glutathione S-transferase N-terminal domain-containing protein [Nostoc sp. T09]|uniref:glutathione S-transferase N-terminal domain-containing protein n=1 Tax=Nostoc sp. T09 TaxID=1932621 RepID=UPI00211AE597|nr:glutathione S-transferase N-terminal domain-containing protein [Nostoc sp. T09]
MKLFYTPNSPYARIARVAVLELRLGDRIEMQKVTVRDPNSNLLNYNPTGKVPTLATDDGFILSETRIICVYLNHFNPKIKLIADISHAFLQQLEGITGGFLDGIAVWVREIRRSRNRPLAKVTFARGGKGKRLKGKGFLLALSPYPFPHFCKKSNEQSPGIIELEQSRALRVLDYFEKISDKLDQTPKLAHITLASALGLEIRLPELQWRQNYPKLACWYDEFSERPSLQVTKPDS